MVDVVVAVSVAVVFAAVAVADVQQSIKMDQWRNVCVISSVA